MNRSIVDAQLDNNQCNDRDATTSLQIRTPALSDRDPIENKTGQRQRQRQRKR